MMREACYRYFGQRIRPLGAFFLILAFWTLGAVSAFGQEEVLYKELLGPGKKNRIDENIYFTYEFSEKPKMGTVILKLRVFNKKGDQLTPFNIHGRYDMPSMRGAHDSGDQEFKLNKKNDYLLPLNLVMPGDWEVRLTFLKEGSPVFHGRFAFDV